MKRICVFCGSNPGRRPDYLGAADLLGEALVSRSIGLVYGAASVGVMGAVADAVLNRGGQVIGIIPKHLMPKEKVHPDLTELHIVEDMHQRKAMMGNLSDGFVALPGGLGTLEELFEVLTWNQLGIHNKPVGLLNICGFYDLLNEFLQHAVSEYFVKQADQNIVVVEQDALTLVEKISQEF